MDNSIFVSSTGTQTEQLTSPILWHCLHVVKSSPEFKSLSYRVSTDMNGNELLIINREHVTRVFGPPVEPISLTLDPSGKCLLAIPFRPVQHVPITKPKMAILDLPSIHALLQLVAGKGFCFCPGIPAKFLAGRACGKYVVTHRTPFKRFSAIRCPVYFKLPRSMDTTKGGQLPIRTLCPSCRQVAKWAQTLLPVSQTQAQKTAVRPTAIPQGRLLYSVPVDNANKNNPQVKHLNTPTEINTTGSSLVDQKPVPSAVLVPVIGMAAPGSLPLTVVDNTKIPGSIHTPPPSNASTDVHKGNRDANDKPMKRRTGLNSEKAQAVSDSLRQLLRQRSMIRETPSDLAAKYKVDGSGGAKGGEKSSGSRPRSPRSEKSKKNVCRICHKQFSTNLRLSKHVQRHEGNRPNLSQVLRRKIRRRKTSAVLNSVFRGFSSQSSGVKRKNNVLSEWSLQLMLNSLNDLLSSEKRLNVDTGKTNKTIPEKKKARGKRKAEEPFHQRVVENPPTRPGLHRSGSGLAAVQTLLNAAQLADVHDAKSNNFPSLNGLNPEFSNQDLTTKRDADSPSSAKKARQSGRLAAKRAGKKSKRTVESIGANDLSSQGNNDTANAGHFSEEALTNLNLLSTVSLEAELRDSRGSPGLQLLSYAGNLESKMNNVTQKNNKHGLLHQPLLVDSIPTTVADKIHAPRQHIPTTVVSKEDTKATKNNLLPPIPPLILAKDNTIHNPSPHSSSASSPLVPLPASATSTLPVLHQLHNNITRGNGNVPTASTVNLLPREDVLGSNCGAMDLSKPKLLQSVADTVNKSSAPPVSQDSADVLRHLMMINPMPMSQSSLVEPENTHDPRIRLLSSKEADDTLQARMFASAKNYKVDPSKLIAAGHIPGMISTSQTSVSAAGKQGKGKEKFNLPTQLNDKSEIQCGYKWSGSGGLVKERTQLVRELVPSVVMANILNGPVTGSALPKMDNPISAPMHSISKLKTSDKEQQQHPAPPQMTTKLSSYPPVPIASQNSPNPHHITLKPREAPVRPKTPQYVLNLSKSRNDQEAQPAVSASVQLNNKSSPVPFPASILKTSLLNPPSVLIPTSMFTQKPSVPSPINSNPNSKKQNANMSVLAPLRNTVLGTLPNQILPATQLPSSTLATILRHPSKLIGSHPSSKAPEVSFSVTISSAVVPISTPAKSNTVVELTEIKTEPIEVIDKNGKMHTVIPNALGEATVVKIEKPMRRPPQRSSERDSSSPPNLVVDMGADRNVLPTTGKSSVVKTNSNTTKLMMKGKVSIVNSPLKCEFCSQIFRTIRDHDYHKCLKKP